MHDDVDAQDTTPEVDATFRTLRRVAIGYFVVFLLAVAAFPVLSLSLDWWFSARLLGGLSPGFAMAAFGMYLTFALIGIAAASLSSAVESRMLGDSGVADLSDHAEDDVPVEGDRVP